MDIPGLSDYREKPPSKTIGKHEHWASKSHSGVTLHSQFVRAYQRILAPHCIRMCFRPFRTLSNILVHPKDPVPPNQRIGVVYQIPCVDRLWHDICWSDRTHPPGPHGGTFKSPDECRSPDLSPGWTCTGLPPWHCIEESWGFGFQPTPEPKICLRGIAYMYIRSQPHPMNRESGLLPHMYNLLIKPSFTPNSAGWHYLPSFYLSIPPSLLSILCVNCASWVTVSLIIAHPFPNYHPIPVMLLYLSRFL